MNLYYVEHSVVTTANYAIIANDEAHLKELLDKRASQFKETPFVAKPKKDGKGNTIAYVLNKDWDGFTC